MTNFDTTRELRCQNFLATFVLLPVVLAVRIEDLRAIVRVVAALDELFLIVRFTRELQELGWLLAFALHQS